jgi:hypothetical protein
VALAWPGRTGIYLLWPKMPMPQKPQSCHSGPAEPESSVTRGTGVPPVQAQVKTAGVLTGDYFLAEP